MKTSLMAVTAMTAALVALPVQAATPASSAPAAEPRGKCCTGDLAGAVLDWERTALRTIYTEAASPPPVGTLFLGFSALAVHDAVERALRRGVRPDAAAARAAHDVLAEYFPSSTANLDADLDASLTAVPDGRREAVGVRIGRRAAARMIESRVGDGRDDRSIVFTVPTPVPVGVWEPPETGMLAPWLGFVKPLVLDRPVRLNGHDPLRSKAYARDFRQVKRLGRTDSTARTAEQTSIAVFFNISSVGMQREALIQRLERHPLSVRRTARMFAGMDAAAADTIIQAWRHKYVDRFWRPWDAIHRAAEDRNPATRRDTAWEPLLPKPPYADWISGHGSVTSSFAETVRLALGNRTPLTLTGTMPTGEVETRRYRRLSALEHHAYMSRIWGGLHFDDAMADAYRAGHLTARRVWAELAR
jgi:hypothetical protein